MARSSESRWRILRPCAVQEHCQQVVRQDGSSKSMHPPVRSEWRSNLTLLIPQVFQQAFESAEYMHIKNSILVLTKIAPFFPLKTDVGDKLEAAVAELVLAEKREDLKIFAQGYRSVPLCDLNYHSCRFICQQIQSCHCQET